MCKKGPPKGRERRTGATRRPEKEATPHCHWGVVNKARSYMPSQEPRRAGKTFERGGV